MQSPQNPESADPATDELPLFMSRKTVAQKANCHIGTVDGWISKGKLKCVKINGLTRIHRDDFLALAKPHRRVDAKQPEAAPAK